MSHGQIRLRGCAVLALLVLGGLGFPAAHAEEACLIVAEAQVPLVAARDGTPFAVGFLPSPCFWSEFDEIRAWVGNATHQASRMFDGSAWASSQNYRAVSLFPVVEGRVWVPLRAAPDATHGQAFVKEAAAAELWLRARGAAGAAPPVRLGEAVWLEADAVRGHWGDAALPIVAVHAPGGVLLSAAPAGIAADGSLLPPGFAFMALPADAPPSPSPPVQPGDALLVRVAPALQPEGSMFEVFVQGGLGDLAGLRVVSRGGSLTVPPLAVSTGAVVRFAVPVDVDVAPLAAQVPDVPLPSPLTLTWGAETAPGGAVAVAGEAGRFRLAQSGGSLALLYGDVVLDSFAYGEGAVPEAWSGAAMEATRVQGRVFLRAWDDAGFLDTDRAADWDRPRIHRQHQADHATAWFQVEGPVRVFACPDRCLEEVVLRVEAAASSIDVNLYELTSVEAVQALAAASQRGVQVRVVVDERPVAASAARMDRVAWAVDLLNEAGVSVYALGRERFDVNHAKYLVVDDVWSVVLTENAVSRGWPADGVSGNRGHGVAVHDAALAAWMRAVFESDALHASDARLVSGRDLHADAQSVVVPAASPPPAPGRLPTLVLQGGFPVAPLLAPDHLADPARHPVAELLAGVTHEAGMQQMNLPMEWRRAGHVAASPLISALAAAAERGVWVNGTLAGAFVEPGRDGNDVTAAALSAFSASMDVRLGGAPHPDGIVHAKTWWGDPGRGQGWVVIGSANGNLASQALNREVSFVVAHPEAAAYVAALAALDHARAASAEVATRGDAAQDAHEDDAPEAVPIPVLLPGLLLVVVLGLVGLQRRRVNRAR